MLQTYEIRPKPQEARMITVEIHKNLASFTRDRKGNRKEVNICSWNKRGPGLDLRYWTADEGEGKRALKGIWLSFDEAEQLRSILNQEDFDHYRKSIPDASAFAP